MSEAENGSGQGLSQSISAKDVLENVSQEAQEAPETQEGEQKAAEKTEEKAQEQSQTKQERLFASKFAALSRKEKALRQQEQQLKARMAEIEARMQSMQAPAESQKPSEPLEVRLRKNPFGTLQEMGMDYETLTKIALNDGKITPEIQMQLMREELEREYKNKFQEIETKLTEKEKREEENRHKQVIENFRTEISDFVQEKAAEYELLSVEGEDGTQLIFDVIEEHYKETGEILDKKDAADLVEEHLLEEAQKRLKLGKIQKLVGASNPQKSETKKSSVTLSNTQSQTAQAADRFLSDEESKAKAAKLIRWIED